MKNIELKVRCDDTGAIVRRLRRAGATRVGILRQTDTYFRCSDGRLKLREIRGKQSELIAYHRPDRASSRASTYDVIPLERPQANHVRSALTATLGVRSIVRKVRVLWLLRHTRIHLDSVETLGHFVELETVVRGISTGEARREHGEIIEVLGLSGTSAIAGSYDDLMKD